MRRSGKGFRDLNAKEGRGGAAGAEVEERRGRARQAAAPSGKKKSFARELAETIVIAVLLAVVIRTFVIQAFKIPSGSMLHTLQIGDHILVNKFIYRFNEPGRGDVIVFLFPEDESRDFIKRIIGLPGETMEIRNRVVHIDGKPLAERYVTFQGAGGFGNPHTPFENFGPVHIPPGKLFVMGDNRDSSMDSRAWGFLDRSKIRGKAMIIYWSWKPDPNAPELSGCAPSEPLSCLLVPWSLLKLWAYNVIHLPDRTRWDRIGMLVR